MNNDSIALSERARAACADMRRAFHHLALLLVELVDEGHLRHLGYASLTEYAATVLDLSPREARGLYRLGTAFPTMPALATAMEAGALDWTKARELLRVITPDTEAEWVARAQVRTSRELEREVSATPFGAPPPAAGAPIVPESQRGRLILEGERSDIDTIRRAIAVQRARCGLDQEEIDDCALLALLALASIRVAEQAEAAFEAGMGALEEGAEASLEAEAGGVVSDGACGEGAGATESAVVSGTDWEAALGVAFEAELDGVVSGEAGEGAEAALEAGTAGAASGQGAMAGFKADSAGAEPTRPAKAAPGTPAAGIDKHACSTVTAIGHGGKVADKPMMRRDAGLVSAPRDPAALTRAWREIGERYRVVIEHCPDCGRSVSGGAEVSESVFAQAQCDHERVNALDGPDQGRATRAIAPRLRRMVFVRAKWRCEVPGCKNHLWLEVHHFTFVANGGKHVWWNLGVLCGEHHRAVHDGSLAVVRLPSGAVRATHRDGRTYTGPVPTTHVGHR